MARGPIVHDLLGWRRLHEPRTTVQYPVTTRLAILVPHPLELNLVDWLILLASGVLEAVWASALGASDGLRRWRPALLFVVASILSLYGLSVAMGTIPVGTAYAVWTATGATLTVGWAMVRGTEPTTLRRVLLLVGIVACVVGLKVVG